MAMRKSDIEQVNATSKEDTVDFFNEESDSDDSVEGIEEISQSSSKDTAARKRLENYLEEKRLRKELGDDLFDL